MAAATCDDISACAYIWCRSKYAVKIECSVLDFKHVGDDFRIGKNKKLYDLPNNVDVVHYINSQWLC